MLSVALSFLASVLVYVKTYRAVAGESSNSTNRDGFGFAGDGESREGQGVGQGSFVKGTTCTPAGDGKLRNRQRRSSFGGERSDSYNDDRLEMMDGGLPKSARSVAEVPKSRSSRANSFSNHVFSATMATSSFVTFTMISAVQGSDLSPALASSHSLASHALSFLTMSLVPTMLVGKLLFGASRLGGLTTLAASIVVALAACVMFPALVRSLPLHCGQLLDATLNGFGSVYTAGMIFLPLSLSRGMKEVKGRSAAGSLEVDSGGAGEGGSYATASDLKSVLKRLDNALSRKEAELENLARLHPSHRTNFEQIRETLTVEVSEIFTFKEHVASLSGNWHFHKLKGSFCFAMLSLRLFLSFFAVLRFGGFRNKGGEEEGDEGSGASTTGDGDGPVALFLKLFSSFVAIDENYGLWLQFSSLIFTVIVVYSSASGFVSLGRRVKAQFGSLLKFEGNWEVVGLLIGLYCKVRQQKTKTKPLPIRALSSQNATTPPPRLHLSEHTLQPFVRAAVFLQGSSRSRCNSRPRLEGCVPVLYWRRLHFVLVHAAARGSHNEVHSVKI